MRVMINNKPHSIKTIDAIQFINENSKKKIIDFDKVQHRLYIKKIESMKFTRTSEDQTIAREFIQDIYQELIEKLFFKKR